MLSIALVGAERIGAMHAQHIATHPRARLAAVHDANADIASAVATPLGAPAVTDVDAAEIGYAGWLVVEAEQNPAKANPFEYSRMGSLHLRECCRRRGAVGISINPINAAASAETRLTPSR